MYMRILIVDDTEINIRLLEAVLQPSGYDISTVMTGNSSITAVQNEEFDLILMDISLPDISGIEAMKEIRKTSFGDKPIIAVTAHAMRGDREKLLGEGFNGYISKPIDIADTLKEVEQLLK